MSEWGLPDWKLDEPYTKTGKWSLARWRWEFWRRRDDYRSEAMHFIATQKFLDGEIKKRNVNPCADAICSCETLSNELELIHRRFFKKWGFAGALDPRISEQPHDHLLTWDHGGVSYMEGSPIERTEHRASMNLAPNQLAISINLDRPLAEQLKLAKSAAEEVQFKRHGVLIKKPRHRKKWPDYLRLRTH
ncbi:MULTISPECIES: hypothetical protein [unclassified Marinovum]